MLDPTQIPLVSLSNFSGPRGGRGFLRGPVTPLSLDLRSQRLPGTEQPQLPPTVHAQSKGTVTPDSSLPSHQQTLQKNPLPGLLSTPCPGSSRKIPRLSCCNISLTTSLAYLSRIFFSRAQAPSSLAHPVGDRPQFQAPGLKAPGCCSFSEICGPRPKGPVPHTPTPC